VQISILVVEDKPSLNKSLVTMLRREGYRAYGALNMDEAKEVFSAVNPHIVLLDIMLPGGSGCSLIPFFRQRHDCRILMLTALEGERSKRIAYENGADDYITKPFDLNELIYKLNAIKRRVVSEQRRCSIGDIAFDMDLNLLSCGGRSYVVQPSQIKLLKRLTEKYEENDFLEKSEVTQYECAEIDDSQRIQTLVARLRRNLSDIGSQSVSIETIYGKGYKLVVDARKGCCDE